MLEKVLYAINWRMNKFRNVVHNKYKLIETKRFYSKSLVELQKDTSNWNNSLLYPTEFYLDMHRYFLKGLPSEIISHKDYFRQHLRGFGEDAFHSMWTFLFEKYNFRHFLEIGIYRGQVMSLIALLSKINKKEIFIGGIAPFDNSGDEKSKYIDIDYEKDIVDNFDQFKLAHPILLKAYSTDIVAKQFIESHSWDCIYIDGSHDYDVVKYDWELCSRNIKKGGIIVLDDASLYTNFKNPAFAFKGHPGPSLVANEIMNSDFKEVLRVGHNRVFEKIN